MRATLPRVGGRLAAGAAVVVALLLTGAASARASELVYWDNPQLDTIGVVNVDGSGAALLNTAGAGIDAPEGLSLDPIANRLYVASSGAAGDGRISYVDLDGSGGGNLPLAPEVPPVKDPRGVVVDPAGRIAYWLNDTEAGPETISWAALDGSRGGDLPLGGEPLVNAIRLTVDPVAGLLYWGNSDGSFHFAPLVDRPGTAGALGAKSSAGTPIAGLLLDRMGRIFWTRAGTSAVFATAVFGGPTETVNVGSAPIDEPRGIAFDPNLERLYWGNSGKEEASGAIGYWGFATGMGGITPAGVAVDRPQDPLVIKSPTISAPQLALVEGRLQCSAGGYAPDYFSAFFYQAPRLFSVAWTLNGTAIQGAGEATYAPTTGGSYACVVSAGNQAGVTARSSNSLGVTVAATTRPGRTVVRLVPSSSQGAPASLRLLGKARHLAAQPGRLLTLRVRVTNEGAIASVAAKACLRLTKGARRALRAGKCQTLGALAGGASGRAALHLKVRGSAVPGLYRLSIAVPGSQTKVTVHVLG